MARRARTRTRDQEAARAAVLAWNGQHRVGVPVVFWPGARKGEGLRSRTLGPAELSAAGDAVVWVVDHAACIALTHVEIVPVEELLADMSESLRWALNHVVMGPEGPSGWTPKYIAAWHESNRDAWRLIDEIQALLGGNHGLG